MKSVVFNLFQLLSHQGLAGQFFVTKGAMDVLDGLPHGSIFGGGYNCTTRVCTPNLASARCFSLTVSCPEDPILKKINIGKNFNNIELDFFQS